MRRLIIGYGNPLRGDDAAGYLAAQRLQETNTDIETEIVAVQQLTPELVDPISRAGEVVFIDAAVGEVPGEIQRRDIAPSSATQPFSHYATPEGLLAAARALYGTCPAATLITVTIETTEFGETLSPRVRTALESLARQKELWVDSSLPTGKQLRISSRRRLSSRNKLLPLQHQCPERRNRQLQPGQSPRRRLHRPVDYSPDINRRCGQIGDVVNTTHSTPLACRRPVFYTEPNGSV